MITILFTLIRYVVWIYMWAIILAAVYSMLVAFGVLDTRNRIVWSIGDFLFRVTEPVLRPISQCAAQFRRHRYQPVDRCHRDPARRLPGARPPRSRYRVWRMAGTRALMSFWTARADAIQVAVKVHPSARRPGLHEPAITAHGCRLPIAVTEPPEDGRANRAACVALAQALGVAPSSVTVAAGASNRNKLLRVAGDPTALAARLQAL